MASGNATMATASSSTEAAHALLGAKSWGGAVDVHVAGPHELKLSGPDGSGHLGSTRLSSTLRVTFHFGKLVQSDAFGATWAGTAHWNVTEHEYHELSANGRPFEWGPGEGSSGATTKATFSINFPEETGKGPGYWSIDLGDPSIHYRSTTSDIVGRTETWSGEGTTDALDALEEADLGGRLPANGYIHGTKVETKQSRMAEAGARIAKDLPPSMKSLGQALAKVVDSGIAHPAGPGSQMVMPKSAVHWTILANPCTGEDHRIRIAHAAFEKWIVFDDGGVNDSEFGQAGINPAQYASMAEDIDWAFPAVSGLQVVVGRGTLCNSTDCTFNVQFKGIPGDNSGYGHKKVSLHLPGFESCVKPKSLKVTYLYSRDGNDNPKGSTEPNWFYYWSETAAAAAAKKRLVRIVYSGDKAGCTASGGIVGGYFASWGDVIANPSEDQEIHLCAGLVQIKWTNPITGRTTSGIDAYGVTVLHELAHKRHFDEWFRAIVHEIGEAERLHNRRLENKLFKKALAMDRDGDDIPDRLECHRSKKTGRQDCPRWRGIKAGIFDSCGLGAAEHLVAKNQNALPAGKRNGEASDEHCLIFRYDEPKWRLGSANLQDWACPGKQSGNRCGPEVASEEEPHATRTREDTRSAPSGVEPLSYSRSRETPRKSTHAEKAPSEQRGAKRVVAAPTPETTRAAALLRSTNPLAQARGLDALGSGNGVKLHERLALMLSGLKRAIAAQNPERVPFYTGFLPRQDWIRLQYVSHLAALGPASLPALRMARQKATGAYREYLTLALAGAGDQHPVRLLTPLVKAGSDWIIRRQAVLLVGTKAGTRAGVQKLLKASLHDPAKLEWRSDAGGPAGFKRHLHPVRDAAALMLYDAGYAIDRTPDGGYVAVWTPAVPRLAHTPKTAPVAASADDSKGVNREMKR